jgi:hypothetical protein
MDATLIDVFEIVSHDDRGVGFATGVYCRTLEEARGASDVWGGPKLEPVVHKAVRLWDGTVRLLSKPIELR